MSSIFCRANFHILGSDILTFLSGLSVPVVCKTSYGYPSHPLIQIKGEVGKDLIFGGGVKLGPNPEKTKFAFHVFTKDMGKLQNGLEPVSLISQEQSQGMPEVKVEVSWDGADFKVEDDKNVTVKIKQESESGG